MIELSNDTILWISGGVVTVASAVVTYIIRWATIKANNIAVIERTLETLANKEFVSEKIRDQVIQQGLVNMEFRTLLKEFDDRLDNLVLVVAKCITSEEARKVIQDNLKPTSEAVILIRRDVSGIQTDIGNLNRSLNEAIHTVRSSISDLMLKLVVVK